MWSEDFDEWFRRRRFPFFTPFFSAEFEKMMEEFDRYFQEIFRDLERMIPKELVREQRLPDGSISKRWGPFVYGYSITIGPDGKPQIREFGNIKPSLKEKPLEVTDKREPLVDIIEENGNIKVIAEVPGVEKEDIKLELEPKSLTISVDAERKYYKKVSLPVEVDTEQAKASYKNGVLEVNLKKLATGTRGKSIKVE
ncbi:MAG: archaeal heat shock protein Hsp20 [Nitrososphaerales archaeon]